MFPILSWAKAHILHSKNTTENMSHKDVYAVRLYWCRLILLPNLFTKCEIWQCLVNPWSIFCGLNSISSNFCKGSIMIITMVYLLCSCSAPLQKGWWCRISSLGSLCGRTAERFYDQWQQLIRTSFMLGNIELIFCGFGSCAVPRSPLYLSSTGIYVTFWLNVAR